MNAQLQISSRQNICHIRSLLARMTNSEDSDQTATEGHQFHLDLHHFLQHVCGQN